jgi:hypothetical protein
LYDNEPSLESLTLFAGDPPTPVVPATTVLSPVDDLDSIFTASLVINF